jgi:UDP-glucose 4-epimerase
MRILVTGSAGHLGEALMRTLRDSDHDPIGLDVLDSPFTDVRGSIVDREIVRRCMHGVDAVLHAATLHKPHVATHRRQEFVDVNVSGTLNLLEEAARAGVGAFVFTSTTSAFGRALTPPAGQPAAWLTEDVAPVPRNIYGVTKVAAENLCELSHRDSGMSCVILRTSRFFPEEDDQKAVREAREDANNKANEFLYRRVDIEDVVDAHLLAIEKAASLGFARCIISATTPFKQSDLAELRADAPAVVQRYVPDYAAEYARRGWTMFESIDRVYDNARARAELGWRPRHDFARVVERLRASGDVRSALAEAVGVKGYHRTVST